MSTFLKDAVASPILGIDFLRKFKQSHCFYRNQPDTVRLFSSSPTHQYFAFSSSVRLFFLSSLTPIPALVLTQPPTATTSSQPSAVSAYLVQNPEVKSSSFTFKENQSLLDSPPSYQKIPDSVPDDVKILLQKISLYLTHWGCEANT
jgi:hypothetical protein